MRTAHTHSPADDGFGLVEVVVAMVLFMAISVAILPMLASGIKRSVDDQNVTAASQLVDSQLDTARTKSPSCSSVASLAGTAASTTAAGMAVTTTTTVTGAVTPGTPCPTPTSSYPTTVTVTTAVTRTSSGAGLARASTQVYVNAP